MNKYPKLTGTNNSIQNVEIYIKIALIEKKSLFTKIIPFSGAAAAWCWSDCEAIPHVQGQRSPSKMVSAGEAATWCWSDFEEIPHI